MCRVEILHIKIDMADYALVVFANLSNFSINATVMMNQMYLKI